jgi:hypothetical protein
MCVAPSAINCNVDDKTPIVAANGGGSLWRTAWP